jgi:hypothetical protein
MERGEVDIKTKVEVNANILPAVYFSFVHKR